MELALAQTIMPTSKFGKNHVKLGGGRVVNVKCSGAHFSNFLSYFPLLLRLTTVPSLADAVAAGDYVTHLGPCGACSSLQDLAVMINTDSLPMEANDCFWESGGLEDFGVARACFERLGFTSNCARIMASYQDRINRRCSSFCAAFALGQGQSAPACEESASCYPCVDLIEQRYKIVAGRLDTLSGYPSWSAAQCDEIAPLDIVSQGDVCQDAKFVNAPAPVATPVGIMPVLPSPTKAPTPRPTARPTPNPTTAATARPSTARPTPNPTPAATASRNVQLCRETSAIEISLSSRVGGTVVCDCDDDSPMPKCYSSPERTDDQVCAIQFGTCSTVSDCCNAGVRGCRGGLCRSGARTQLKSSLRIGASVGGRGRGGGSVDATRGGTRDRRRIKGIAPSSTHDLKNEIQEAYEEQEELV
jgi:hypothetical protein